MLPISSMVSPQSPTLQRIYLPFRSSHFSTPTVSIIRIIRSDGPQEWNNPNLTDEQKQNEGEIALDHYAFDYIVGQKEAAKNKAISENTVG